MSDYDPSPKGLENLSSIFNQGMDYFNTHFTPSTPLEKETFFFDSDSSEIAIQSMEDRFKDSNTFGEFSSGNTFGEGNFSLITSDFQPSKTSWKNLYNENHTSKTGIAYHYSENINNDRLNIRHPNPDGDIPAGSISQRRSSTLVGREPYIVNDISQTSNTSGGRQINFGSREFPIQRAATDTERISKFLASPAGIMFIGKQYILAFLAQP